MSKGPGSVSWNESGSLIPTMYDISRKKDHDLNLVVVIAIHVYLKDNYLYLWMCWFKYLCQPARNNRHIFKLAHARAG